MSSPWGQIVPESGPFSRMGYSGVTVRVRRVADSAIDGGYLSSWRRIPRRAGPMAKGSDGRRTVERVPESLNSRKRRKECPEIAMGLRTAKDWTKVRCATEWATVAATPLAVLHSWFAFSGARAHSCRPASCTRRSPNSSPFLFPSL